MSVQVGSALLLVSHSVESTAARTLQQQFSGYGANMALVNKTLDNLGIKEPSGLENWGEDMVRKVVRQV